MYYVKYRSCHSLVSYSLTNITMCLLQIYAGISLCLITTIAHTAPAPLITTDNISTFREISLHIFP